jgi:S-adenosylmethionine hydrolase
MAVITLITDFGLQDGNVGAMKGVIHSIAPSATIVDISHHVPPQDVQHGGFVLMTAYPFWPPTTIHVVVDDPGVGTKRRAVAVKTQHGTFVAPDNGVLSYVLARERVTAAAVLTDPAYWHHPISPVFHGRDIFGPAAAHLANGVPLNVLGGAISVESLVAFPIPTPRFHADGHITAHVQHIDRFGNCTTDLAREVLRNVSGWQIRVGNRSIDNIRTTFGDVPEGEPVALIDSTGYLAIGVRNGSAAQELDLKEGDAITLWPTLR